MASEGPDDVQMPFVALGGQLHVAPRALGVRDEIEVPIEQATLVIGGGVAGIQAALDLADSGFKVILAEKEPSIGGMMARLDKTFPTMDCSI